MMQYIGRRYVPYLNYAYGTSGSIREGRYTASLIQDEQYLLTCMRYIELNSVRANMVQNPSMYRWSSYRHNAQGIENELIQAHSVNRRLGKSLEDRCDAPKALFRTHIDGLDLKDIRAALQTGTPLGNDYFRERIAAKLKKSARIKWDGQVEGPDPLGLAAL